MLQRFSKEKIGFLSVVLVSLAFIITRIAMPIKFDGSYIDEYWHITSGISLFESGIYSVFYNDSEGYDRGLFMSLWVGFLMTAFGKSLIVAKLAPISIAVVNYFLLLFLAIKLIDKRRFQLLLLLLYTLSPWVLFNHSYIRFYIVNELFLLILLVLGYQLYAAMNAGKWKSVFLFLSLLVFLNLFNFAATKDQSAYMLLLATGVMFAGLFIYEFNTGLKIDQRLFSVIAGDIWLSTRIQRTVVVLVVAAFGFIVLDAGSKIDFLLNGELAYTSLAKHKYNWFFWEINGVITAFFVLAVATFWWKCRGYDKVFFPVAGLLFLIHIAASEDLQIVRGILYFLPVYYLAAVMGASKAIERLNLKDLTQWLSYVVISSLFLFFTVTNVERSFYYGPRIKYEINYIEYGSLYDAVEKNCIGKLIVEATPSSPFIAKFYDVNVDYVFSTAEHAEEYGLFLMDENTGKYKTVWGSTPVITDINELQSLNRGICLTVRNASRKVFLPLEAEEMLISADRTWNFHNVDLYLLERKSLLGTRKR